MGNGSRKASAMVNVGRQNGRRRKRVTFLNKFRIQMVKFKKRYLKAAAASNKKLFAAATTE
jgi:translation initiation factor 1 (eIF-1/SUI1)